MMETLWHGVVATPVTSFAEDKLLDLNTARRLVDFQIAHGADAVALPMHTGESLDLSIEERKQLAEVAVAAAAGRVPVIVHASMPACRPRTTSSSSHATPSPSARAPSSS